MEELFRAVDRRHLLFLLQAILAEGQFVFVSSSPFRIKATVQILLRLIYPFRWNHPYMAHMTMATIGVLSSLSGPFVIGFMGSVADLIAKVPEAELKSFVLVDLDHKLVRPSVASPSWMPLPEQLQFRLRKSINLCSGALFLSTLPGSASNTVKALHHLQLDFVHVFASLLYKYIFCFNASSMEFDAESFVRYSNRKHQSFLKMFVRTRLFSGFIETMKALKRVPVPMNLFHVLVYEKLRLRQNKYQTSRVQCNAGKIEFGLDSGNYKDRYLLVSESKLKVCRGERNQSQVDFEADLLTGACVIEIPPQGNSTTFEFSIKPSAPSKNSRVWRFRTDSESSRQTWVELLEAKLHADPFVGYLMTVRFCFFDS
jgi:hypothetical protein